MLYTLVRHNKIHETGAESSTSERDDNYDKLLSKFYGYLKANVDDKSVERFDITILNSLLIPIKTDHFERAYEEEGAE